MTGVVARFVSVCFAFVSVHAAASVSSAQTAVPEPESAQDSALLSATALAAQRVALVDLRLLDSPAQIDYRVAHDMFSIIAELDPDDLGLARRSAAAAFGLGDAELLKDATRRVIRLDPGDTVSQLRLITANISEMQTVEQRLGAYARFLGKAGERLDPSVRSRLALDAALLHRERGEDDMFVERLSAATALDPTNKEAATLAFNYYASQLPEDSVGQLRLQFNLMYADPLDPLVHMSIAKLLAQEGAAWGCARFHNLGMLMLTLVDAVDPSRDVERLALAWQLQGPQVVVNEIAGRLAGERAVAAEIFEEAMKLDVPDEELVPPETISLDPLYEKMRILAALAAGDFVQVEVGLEGLEAIFDRARAELADLNRSLEPELELQRRFATVQAMSDLQFMRAIANVDIERFEAEARTLGNLEGPLQAALAPFAAWVQFRNGDPEAALRTAANIESAFGVSVGTQVLRALALESLGSIEAALEVYRELTVAAPLGPTGAWARSRSLQILELDDPRTPAGRQMEALAMEVPQVLDRMLIDHTSFLEFKLDAANHTIAPGEPVRLALTIRNVSSIPLSLGPDRPLNSRVLLTPLFDSREVHVGRGQPEVVELDRRLRLMPRESLTVEVDVDAGFNGLINLANTPLLRDQRWRAIQGFRLGEMGQFEQGALCSTDDTPGLLLQANTVSRLGPTGIAEAIAKASTDDEFMLAVRAAAAAFYRATPATLPPPTRPGFPEPEIPLNEVSHYEAVPGSPTTEELAPLAAALGDAFVSADPIRRAFMLATLPPASVTPALEAFDDVVLEYFSRPEPWRDGEHLIACALVALSRVDEPEHPVLLMARASPEPRLNTLASGIGARLELGVPTMATSGPGINELTGPTRRVTVERARAGVR